MVNSEELIGTAQIYRYRRGVAQTSVVITEDYNFMVNSEELIGTAQICRYRRGVAQTSVVITEDYNVMVNSEELIGTAQICRYRRGVAQTSVVITEEYNVMVNSEDLFLISNFRRVLNVVCFLLGYSPASEFYMPTFPNTLSVPSSQAGRYLPVYEDGTDSVFGNVGI